MPVNTRNIIPALTFVLLLIIQPAACNSPSLERVDTPADQEWPISKVARQSQGKSYLWSFPLSSAPRALDVSSDGTLVLVGEGVSGQKGEKKLYLLSNDGKEIWNQTFPPSEEGVRKAVLSDEGGRACALTKDMVHVFSTEHSSPVANISSSEGITCMDMSSDGSKVAVGFGGMDQRLVLYSSTNFSTALWSYTPSQTGDHFIDVELSSNGEIIAAVTDAGQTLYLFNSSSSASPVIWQAPLGSVPSELEIDANASVIAVASENIMIFSRDSDLPGYNISTQVNSSIAVSSDGSRVAACTAEPTLYLINTTNVAYSSDIYSLVLTTQATSLALDRDGDCFLVGLEYLTSGQRTIQFYSNDSPVPVWSREEWSNPTSTAISDDGTVGVVGLEGTQCKLLCFATNDTMDACISSPAFFPSSGDEDTMFNFSAVLSDPSGTAPISASVFIDGISHIMLPSDGTIALGKRYYYATNLSAGAHNFSFEFNTATGKIRLPPYGAYEGPEVSIVPGRIVVEDLGYTPRLGDANTTFTFTARYKHGNGTAPTKHDIVIGGATYEMAYSGGDYKLGATYTYSTKFAASRASSDYHFEFSDGEKTVRAPISGAFTGPAIYSKLQNPPSIIDIYYPKTAYPGQLVSVVAIVNDSDETPIAHVYMLFENGTNIEMVPIGYLLDGFEGKFVMNSSLNFTIWAEDSAGQQSWSNGTPSMGGNADSNSINVSSTPNGKPSLTDLKAKRGNEQEYSFYVTYKDAEGDEPYYCDLVLDDRTTIKMELFEGVSAISGLVYVAYNTLGKGTHKFVILTTDGINNVTSEEKHIEVNEPATVPLVPLIAALAVTLACAGIVSYLWWRRANSYTVDQMLLLYHDGRLLWHKSRGATVVDQDILGSMLSAVQDFMRDSFTAKGQLDELKYGSLRLVMERGNKMLLVVALSAGKASSRLRKQMKESLGSITREYGEAIISWDGVAGKFDGVEKYLGRMFDESAKGK